jgi:phosphatidylserine/phosphatidylglycerophosphate/cardiolipin synthase-like enzyme
MAVVYFQLIIIGTILVAHLGAGHLRRWTGRHGLTPLQAAVLAGAGWSLFTVMLVIMPQLMAVQMLTSWGTVGVLWRQRAAVEADIRRQLGDQVVERVLEAARAQPLKVIAGRAHQRELRRALDGGAPEPCDPLRMGERLRDRLGFPAAPRRRPPPRVKVYIGYGWTSGPPSPPSPSEARVIRTLDDLARDAKRWGRGQLRVVRYPTHVKMLICDERYAICGSHNWLSNAEFSNEERSWLVSDPTFVGYERDEIIARLSTVAEVRVGS